MLRIGSLSGSGSQVIVFDGLRPFCYSFGTGGILVVSDIIFLF